MRRRLLLIGPITPPKGGVSVHIHRLSSLLGADFAVSYLDESRQIKPGIPNIRRMSPWRYLACIGSADVVHVHSFSGGLKFVHVLCARMLLRRVVLTVHSVMQGGLASRLMFKLSTLFSHTVVAVSLEAGQLVSGPSKIIPAFIPPSADELIVGADVAEWIAAKKDEGRFVFASNAYRLERHQGVDLYGLDLIIDAFSISPISRLCACIFIVGSPEFDPERLESLKKVIAQRQIVHCFNLLDRPENFPGVVALCDGTIRATNTDGDALSVRESIQLGKVTIASDAAARPEGTRLFKSRDEQSLVDAILAAIQRHTCGEAKALGLSPYRDLYTSIYRGRDQAPA